MDKITSNASWSIIDNSSDTHNTVEQAEGVCKALKENWGIHPCEIRGICTDSWVEVNGKKIYQMDALDREALASNYKGEDDLDREALGEDCE